MDREESKKIGSGEQKDLERGKMDREKSKKIGSEADRACMQQRKEKETMALGRLSQDRSMRIRRQSKRVCLSLTNSRQESFCQTNLRRYLYISYQVCGTYNYQSHYKRIYRDMTNEKTVVRIL